MKTVLYSVNQKAWFAFKKWRWKLGMWHSARSRGRETTELSDTIAPLDKPTITTYSYKQAQPETAEVGC